MKEIRRRTRVVGAFPDGKSALMLVSARLRHVSTTHWGMRKYMNMNLLKELDTEKQYKVAWTDNGLPPIKSAKDI